MTTKGKVLVLVSSGHGLRLKDDKVYKGAGYYLNELTVPTSKTTPSGKLGCVRSSRVCW